MRFWDSSAILPVVYRQQASTVVRDLLAEDGEMSIWWGTWIECAVTISRLKREGALDEESEANARLDRMADGWSDTEPPNGLRLPAALLSKEHPLKAADCLQLAAALRWCEGDAGGADFVCLDNLLRQAAQSEEFTVLPKSTEIE